MFPWEILHFLQQEVLQRPSKGESRDLSGEKVSVIAEAFKMCHDLREAMTHLSSDKPPWHHPTQRNMSRLESLQKNPYNKNTRPI